MLYTDVQYLPGDRTFYSQLLPVLEQEDIMPQIYNLLRHKGKLSQTPLDFQMKLQRRRETTMFQNMYVKRETEQVLRLFDRVGISAIWLKGTRFAERFFGDLGDRPTSDIDILVPRELSNEVISALLSIGYDGPHNDIPGHYHETFIKQTNDLHPLILEVHYNVIRTTDGDVNLKEFWEEAQIIESYQCIYELSINHTFYMACIHATRHWFESEKTRIDILQILNNKDFTVDLFEILNKSRRDDTLSLVCTVLSNLYELYPFLKGVQSLPHGLENNHFRTRFRSKVALNLAIIEGWPRKIQYLNRWLFPPAQEARLWIRRGRKEHVGFLQLYVLLYWQRLNKLISILTTADN
ncbi:nucleotidyltransferase family protein [Alicyclobacillus fodiniaquatilis]|uniref:Nucleotidyltransferase family protein n=1 Tax=Alicyclobacillus fodiniaquatilis TaxID=1661150 RepID=A0ABW4JD91_9BACL